MNHLSVVLSISLSKAYSINKKFPLTFGMVIGTNKLLPLPKNLLALARLLP
jgi:hypothetical protein